ncbi:MAG TPA: response regulator transcription factor [Phycisphaerae bacterium]|nr:response regulator transcription factor [Phycisphaerae bacterium]
MNGPTKVFVVDDHALVRGALCERLDREAAISVVGSARTADEAIEQIARTRPDVVLMDIDMPGVSCFDAARQIAADQPATHVIFLSAFFNDHYIEQALAVKAKGYLTKREPPEDVVAAIREVANGGAYFSEEVRSRIVVDARGASLAQRSRSRVSTLTTRELEVLRYVARGMAKKQIARVMHISPKTVDRHSFNLMTKLDIHDRVELSRFAIREGLAEP